MGEHRIQTNIRWNPLLDFQSLQIPEPFETDYYSTGGTLQYQHAFTGKNIPPLLRETGPIVEAMYNFTTGGPSSNGSQRHQFGLRAGLRLHVTPYAFLEIKGGAALGSMRWNQDQGYVPLESSSTFSGQAEALLGGVIPFNPNLSLILSGGFLYEQGKFEGSAYQGYGPLFSVGIRGLMHESPVCTPGQASDYSPKVEGIKPSQLVPRTNG